MPAEAFPDPPLERLYGPGIRSWTETKLSKSVRRLILPGLPISAIPRPYRWPALLGLLEWESQGNAVDPAIRESYLISLRNRAPRFRPEFLEDLALLSLILREKMLSRESANAFLQRAQQAKNLDATTMLLDYLGRLPPPDPGLEAERMLQELDTGEMAPARFKASWRGRRNEDGTMTLLEYLGAEPHVFPPARVKDTPVTALGNRLFRGRTDLLSIVVPEGIRTIPPKAFAGCKNLTRVELPDTLEEIGKAAFLDCESLQGICVENEALLDSQLLRARNAVYCLIWTVNRIF